MRTFQTVKRVTENGVKKAIISWEDDVLGIYHLGVDNPPATGLTACARTYMDGGVVPIPAPPLPNPILAKIDVLTLPAKDVLKELAGR